MFGNHTDKHHASREWVHERYYGFVSIPLLIWLIISLMIYACGCYGDLKDFLSEEINAALLVIFIGFFMCYSVLAIKVVFEDYVHNIKLQRFLIILTKIVSIAAFVLALVSVLKISGLVAI